MLLITLNRPEARNAVNLPLAEGIAAALEELDGESSLSVGVLTGAGKGFCAGMDLKAFVTGERPWVGDRGFAGIVRRASVKPLIAAVEGFAVAGGLEVALACDLIVAARGAKFGHPRGQALAGGGGRRAVAPAALLPLQRRDGVGAHRRADARRAGCELGLVNRLAEPGAAVEVALGLAREIAANAPLALAASKRILQEQWDWSCGRDVGSPERDLRPGVRLGGCPRGSNGVCGEAPAGLAGPLGARGALAAEVACCRALPRIALAFALAHDHHEASPEGSHQRSPGAFFGYCETGMPRSSAVLTMRLCSAMCAAG